MDYIKRVRLNNKCCNGHDLTIYGKYYGKDKDQLYCTECRRIANKKWHTKKYKDDPQWQIKKHLRLNYNMTVEERLSLLKAQQYKCAICGTKDFGVKGPTIDHCHRTLKIRGILCQKCNRGLGLFTDNIIKLQSAINYLQKDR